MRELEGRGGWRRIGNEEEWVREMEEGWGRGEGNGRRMVEEQVVERGGSRRWEEMRERGEGAGRRREEDMEEGKGEERRKEGRRKGRGREKGG